MQESSIPTVFSNIIETDFRKRSRSSSSNCPSISENLGIVGNINNRELTSGRTAGVFRLSRTNFDNLLPRSSSSICNSTITFRNSCDSASNRNNPHIFTSSYIVNNIISSQTSARSQGNSSSASRIVSGQPWWKMNSAVLEKYPCVEATAVVVPSIAESPVIGLAPFGKSRISSEQRLFLLSSVGQPVLGTVLKKRHQRVPFWFSREIKK